MTSSVFSVPVFVSVIVDELLLMALMFICTYTAHQSLCTCNSQKLLKVMTHQSGIYPFLREHRKKEHRKKNFRGRNL